MGQRSKIAAEEESSSRGGGSEVSKIQKKTKMERRFKIAANNKSSFPYDC